MKSISLLRVLTCVCICLQFSVAMATVNETPAPSPGGYTAPKSTQELCAEAHPGANDTVIANCVRTREGNTQSQCADLARDYNEAVSKCSGACLAQVRSCNGGINSSSSNDLNNNFNTLVGMMSGVQVPATPAPTSLCAGNLDSQDSIESRLQSQQSSLTQAQQQAQQAAESLQQLEEQHLQKVDELNRQIADTRLTCQQQALSNNTHENQVINEQQQQIAQRMQELRAAQSERNSLQLNFNNAYRRGNLAIQALSDAEINRTCNAQTRTYVRDTYSSRSQQNGRNGGGAPAVSRQSGSAMGAVGTGTSAVADVTAQLNECIQRKRADRNAKVEELQDALNDITGQIQTKDTQISEIQNRLNTLTQTMAQDLQNLRQTNQLQNSKCANQVTAFMNEYNREVAAYPSRRQNAQQAVMQAQQQVAQITNDVNTLRAQSRGISGMGRSVTSSDAFAAAQRQTDLREQGRSLNCTGSWMGTTNRRPSNNPSGAIN